MLINERVAGVASRGTAHLVFFLEADQYKKHCHFFHFLCFVVDLRFLCYVCLVLFLFFQAHPQTILFGYFRSFMVCWTAPCSFWKYRTQKIRHLYTDITWRHTKVSQYCSSCSFNICRSLWLTIFPRNVFSCVFSHSVFSIPTFSPALQKLLFISTSMECMDFTYDIFILSLIHLLTRPLTYLSFRWNFLPWSLCTNHRQRKANRNHGSSAPWSCQQLWIESAMRSAWTWHRGIPLKKYRWNVTRILRIGGLL